MSLLDKTIGWLAPAECLICGSENSCLCLACQQTEISPFGERCYRCNKISPFSATCTSCRPASPSHVWIAGEYFGALKLLIRRTKYTHTRAGAKDIALILADCLTSFINEDDLREQNYLIIPVPTATSRVRERSFDHTLLITRHLAKNCKLSWGNCLRRIGQSRQVGAKRDVRARQLAGSFYLSDPRLVKDRRIILIDDVVTTGATLMACTKVLRKAGAKSVDGLVLAKRI